jgi:hypothetical protein
MKKALDQSSLLIAPLAIGLYVLRIEEAKFERASLEVAPTGARSRNPELMIPLFFLRWSSPDIA